ncbi:SseB family protein [Streptomyces sp. BE147]|uniref:SseB family protein n=1 Tax=Streptomyces sp. BE147 TaxID=3002524 RepID=UPI002E7A123A|nr:SseB family protein [Streptomyces sp. BE147]MEE1740076.1 SseB family protein [Streptomyces sp. BE147]
MGFDEEWARLKAEAAKRAASTLTVPPVACVLPAEVDPVEQAREAVRERLADFRSRVVLVPLEERDGLWTAEFGGLDWICAFSDEAALARFAAARGEEGREWSYRRVVGARLLDEVVPLLDFPCGVALNAAGLDGAVFPPVRGIVPDAAALDGEAA